MSTPGAVSSAQHWGAPTRSLGGGGFTLVAVALLVVMYWRSAQELYQNWTFVDSYYAHGFLVPFVSGYFVWRDRHAILSIPARPSASGLLWMAGAALLLLMGDFLGFRVLSQLSMLPMIAGILIVLQGTARTARMWFPLAFLFFMIPIPSSLTQSIALQLKFLAARCALLLGNLLTLPFVQEGSYIHFGNDRILIGDVCGGLRSLISLLALGALFAYIARLKNWARVFILLMSGPIAIVSNVFRIFLLCVIGYYWGSETAGGWVHDWSGILIYAIAILLFLCVESPLRRWAPAPTSQTAGRPNVSSSASGGVGPGYPLKVAALALLALLAIGHLQIVRAQAYSGGGSPIAPVLNVPPRIADYTQIGKDLAIDARTQELLESSTILSRNYRAPGGRPVQLSIVHAGATRRSLHFPEVCLVGDGWEIVKQESANVGILFSAKRLVLVKGDRAEAVLYWFKTGDVVTGNYFANAWYWAKNQMALGTPSSAMIKLTAPVGPDGDRAAFAVLDDFAAKFAPIMMRTIP